MADNEFINLQNPVAQHFGSFIAGNAMKADRLVKPGSCKGQTLVIAGAGPSLAEHAADYCDKADQVWGCNSAAIWLHENGHKVTHAWTMDQTAHMIEEWWDAPDIEYLLASSVHPHLVDYLLSKDRSVTFYHNLVGVEGRPVAVCECGHPEEAHDPGCSWCECEEYEKQIIPFEHYLYGMLYDPCPVVDWGLNATTRALHLAHFLGFGEIHVLGADCALRTTEPKPDVPFGSPEHKRWLEESTIMHADGGNALSSGATPVTMTGEIDGRTWEIKPDLAITAVWLVKLARAFKNIHLIGDTLPNALMDKDDEFLARMPGLTGEDGEVRTIEVVLGDAA